MKKLWCILFLFLSFFGQTQTFFECDTTLNVKRTAWVSSIGGVGYAGSLLTLQNIWYKEHWTKFHLFDDSKEWLGMDKIGHAYTSNMITKNISSVYRWAGVDHKKSLLIGSSVAFSYLATLEVLDGFSNQWGFSWSDMGANTLGIGWYVWQDLLWQEQRLKLKFSAHLSPYAQYRPKVLGSTVPQRILKDYNGQTHWLSVSPGQFLGEDSFFPKWLSFSLGYSIDEKLHGDLNEYDVLNDVGVPIRFHAQKQFVFSMDIDFDEIKVKRKWLKTTFTLLNHLKVPFPALVFTGNQVRVSPLYF